MEQGRARLTLTVRDRLDLGLADEKPPPGAHYLAAGDELLSPRRGEEVHLILDCEHLPARRREGQRSITPGGVTYSAGDRAVEVAFLLSSSTHR